jgi:hypothetical protein
MLIDVGWLGSPVDVATFLVVLAELMYRIRPRVETVAAAVVALAERRDDVDDDRLRSDLEVDDRDVDALRTRIVYRDGDES